ncbi:craniofacial development protein 1 [Hippocampus comes]|uniref:Craniofacial development protein 1 n=1 Tax=Hippocampus comes TaxID=109280 RepID=A0A3Q2Y9D6_HIPCM|nr:PREDICTED: craniofacial development protein 1 [Hippocampus comes]XP_019733710.1 PREDICTED: craniofacial development protein 1 [Hippocampus comes]XP_019733711.1 PREDICTED: craniofacial development protein 1 [Hippocampus comes]
MNYTDSDSDGYLSSEDADYVPSDNNVSEDDINECEKEDPLDENDSVPLPDSMAKRKKVKKKNSSLRKRPKRVVKVDKEEKNGDGTEDVEKLAQVQNDEKGAQKKQSDDLWARFLSDVAPRPKASMAGSPSHTTPEANPSASNVCMRTESQESDTAKVTIVKVFDFAGEEVRVNKEVSADSREAKIHFKSQCTQEKTGEESPTSSNQSSCPGPSSKRPAGMSSLLSRIGGKKQKMSTLEKSKMDWDAFKYEEGITEELAIHNRGREGYVERKNFLERVDHRQFEMEKAVRLKNMKYSS